MNRVQMLMLGTANLNHMRSEIKTVVGTVASMIKLRHDEIHYQDKSADVFWTITRSNNNTTVIYCRDSTVEEPLGSWANHESWLYCNVVDKQTGLQDVVRVHQSLEGFLLWIMDLYPQLKEQLRPIFEASEL